MSEQRVFYSYRGVQSLLLKGLALIYLLAFLSLWHQMPGLYGDHGILSIAEHVSFLKQRLGWSGFSLFPSLFWLSSSNFILHSACAGGVIASLVALSGLGGVFPFVVLWMGYLSFVSLGQSFLAFQWDVLLLEAGFLAIFYALCPRAHGLMLALFRWLLFRLMFCSGLVKLTSGDVAWRDLTALSYHYWTQPLPGPWAWWVQQMPTWFHKVSVVWMFGIELIVPFAFFAPRRWRLTAFYLVNSFMLTIMLTGNYGFFNLLTMVLSFCLWDGQHVSFWLRRPCLVGEADACPNWQKLTAVSVAVVIGCLSVLALLKKPVAHVQPWRIVNPYGLFAVMTKQRLEIEIEGSEDGVEWRNYEFWYKPGDVLARPGQVAPYQPRLDWQMWFAALTPVKNNVWLIKLMQRLLENSPAVVRLLRSNPFPEVPPNFIRAMAYQYRFTSPEERAQGKAWWVRELAGVYSPTFQIKSQ